MIELRIFASMNMKKFILLFGICICIFACNDNQEKQINIDGMVQGSYYHISYFGKEDQSIKKGIDSIFKALDKSVSLWDTTSIINKVNNNIKTPLDSIFIDNFNKSVFISNLTNGYFDFSIGGLVQAWGFSNKEKIKISDKIIDSLMVFVGYKNISINNNLLVKKYPQTIIDFNAIAQGYTTDIISDWLISKGIKSFIVDIGGEVYANNKKLNGKKWTCAIEQPADSINAQRKFESYIELENESIVTSGNYRKYYEENGVKFSHTIDPYTGRPVKHSLLSATVVCKKGWLADGLATAFMVMGLDKAKDFLIQHPQYEAHFIFSDEKGSFKTYTTPKLRKRLIPVTNN